MLSSVKLNNNSIELFLPSEFAIYCFCQQKGVTNIPNDTTAPMWVIFYIGQSAVELEQRDRKRHSIFPLASVFIGFYFVAVGGREAIMAGNLMALRQCNDLGDS
jgi:hypothetical protein